MVVDLTALDALAEAWEELALCTDPFAGDFGDGEVLLSDKIVTAAKAHSGCNICRGEIAKGERHRARTEACDGAVTTYRFCRLCCQAMARSGEDGGCAWEGRVGLHAPMAAELRRLQAENERLISYHALAERQLLDKVAALRADLAEAVAALRRVFNVLKLRPEEAAHMEAFLSRLSAKTPEAGG